MSEPIVDFPEYVHRIRELTEIIELYADKLAKMQGRRSRHDQTRPKLSVTDAQWRELEFVCNRLREAWTSLG